MRRASRRIWRPDGNVSSRVAHRSGGPFVMVPCPCRSIVPGRAWGGGQPAPPPRFIHRVYLKLSGVRSAGAMAWPEALPQTEMGAGIAASPHLHRAKDLPVFASLVACAPRSSILAHQLRRRFRWWSSPKAGSVIFRGPSWVGPFRVACSQGEPRTATGRPTLPAPLPVVRLGPKPSSSPSGGDRSFRHLPLLPAVAGSPKRRGLPSRSPM
jgi:hypothetical protein